jgi:hypothetical protein
VDCSEADNHAALGEDRWGWMFIGVVTRNKSGGVSTLRLAMPIHGRM